MPAIDLLTEMRIGESTRLKSNWLGMNNNELFPDHVEDEKRPVPDPFSDDIEMLPQRTMGSILCVYGMFDDLDGGLSEYHLSDELASLFGYEEYEEWASRVFGEDDVCAPMKREKDTFQIADYVVIRCSNGAVVTCKMDELPDYFHGDVEKVENFDKQTFHEHEHLFEFHKIELELPKKNEISRLKHSRYFDPKTKLNMGKIVRKTKRILLEKIRDQWDDYNDNFLTEMFYESILVTES